MSLLGQSIFFLWKGLRSTKKNKKEYKAQSIY